MTLEEKLEKAVVGVLRDASWKLNLGTKDKDELLRRAEEQDGLVLDIMLGLGRDEDGNRTYRLRIHEAESLIEEEGAGSTVEDAVWDILDQQKGGE